MIAAGNDRRVFVVDRNVRRADLHRRISVSVGEADFCALSTRCRRNNHTNGLVVKACQRLLCR